MANKNRINICIVSDFYHPRAGGVETHIFCLSQEYIKMGHKVIIITGNCFPNRQGIRYMTNGLKVYYLPFGPVYYHSIAGNGFCSAFALLRDIFIRERIQIVHAHARCSTIAVETTVFAKVFGIRAVYTFHSLFNPSSLSAVAIDGLDLVSNTILDHFISVSNASKDNVIIATRADPSDISVIPNAIDSNWFYPMPWKSPDYRKELVIILATRLVYRKGIDIAVKIIPKICAKHPHVRFLIVGSGPMKINLNQMKKKYNLHSEVKLEPTVPFNAVPDKLCEAHIYLNCSITESFGMGILEAIFCGLKVVSTNVGGIPEILPPGIIETCEPDAKEMEMTLDRVISTFQPSNFTLNEIKSVTNAYTWKSVAERTLKVYRKTLETKPKKLGDLIKMSLKKCFLGKPIVFLYVMIYVYLVIAEWFDPADNIEPAVDWNHAEMTKNVPKNQIKSKSKR